MASPAQFLEQQSAERMQRKQQEATALHGLQRKFLASQLESVANQELPPEKITDENGQSVNNPDFEKAFARKKWAVEQQQKVYAPEHHANFIDAIHGLITGKQKDAQNAITAPPDGVLPSSPAAASGAPSPSPTASAPPSVHPFSTAEHPDLDYASGQINSLSQQLQKSNLSALPPPPAATSNAPVSAPSGPISSNAPSMPSGGTAPIATPDATPDAAPSAPVSANSPQMPSTAPLAATNAQIAANQGKAGLLPRVAKRLGVMAHPIAPSGGMPSGAAEAIALTPSEAQQKFARSQVQATALHAANVQRIKALKLDPEDEKHVLKNLALHEAGLPVKPPTPVWKQMKNDSTGDVQWMNITDIDNIPPGYHAIEQGTTGRTYVLGSTDPANAIKVMDLIPGTSYKDMQGHDITKEMLQSAPPSTKLETIRQGSNTYHLLVDQKTRQATIGNEVYQVPEIGEISPVTATPLGQAKVGTVSTHEVPGMNPGEKLKMTGTSTPATVGMTSPSAKSAPSVAPSVAPAALPASGGRAPAKAIQKASPTPTVPAQSFTPVQRGQMPPQPSPFASGTFQSQGKTTKPVVAAMDTVAAQVFGQNGDKPIWEYAHMYDNPELATALNKALTLNSLAIPGTEPNPSFMQTLGTAIGVTGWSQERIRNANVDARNEVARLGGDEGMELLARLQGFQEDLSALRSATKGSAAQSSIQTLVRAAPIYNVASSKNFRDQLSATLNTASAAMSGYPEISKKYLDWWREGARQAKGIPTSTSAPKAPAKAGTIRKYNPQTGNFE